MRHHYFYKLLLGLFSIGLFFLIFAKQRVSAELCSFPASGNATISTPCSIETGEIDGVDSGTGSTNTATITIVTGGTLTINQNATLLAGSFSLQGGSLALSLTGAQIRPGSAVYAVDSDGDSYYSNSAWSLSGSTRRSSVSTFDCYDGNANAYPGSSYCSDLHRGDGSYDYDCDGVETFCGDEYNDGWR